MKKKQLDIKIISYKGNNKVRDCISNSDLKEMCDIYNEFASFVYEMKMKYNILTQTLLAHPEWILSSDNIDIAKINGNVVGYVSYSVKQIFEKYVVTITNIHIKSKYKRMGIGSKLIRKLFQDYNNGQFTAACVFNDNYPAEVFWKKLGFVTKLSSDLYVDHTER